jgi:hypothetical protein
MSTGLMSLAQQSARGAVAGQLDEGRAMRLPAERHARWLRVTQGRLWLTHSAQSHDEVPLDCWLEAGDSVELPAGQDAVLESWPSARFDVLDRAPARVTTDASVALKPSAALRRWVQKQWGGAVPAASRAPCTS